MSRSKKQVLFVCIGNICRSPMAEALARHYGSDVLVASSAGVSPALNCAPETRSVLSERNVDLGEHLPRRFQSLDLSNTDLIINMSGQRLATGTIPVEEWPIRDPIGQSDVIYRQVCSDIEMKVMNLILRLRSGKLDPRPVQT